MPINSNIPRAVVENLVRNQVYAKLSLPLPPTAQAPNGLVVNVSARHCHLCPQAVEQLFGRDYALTAMKELYQTGAYAAKETVTLVGPRSRVISNLRILGPCRDFNQVELAYTDAIALGFQAPLRLSGDIEGTPGCMLMGPKGFFEMPQGVIRAAPHVHMDPVDASYYGAQHKDVMKMKVHGDCPVTFDNIVVRVDESFKLEVHIDTDEGNACGLKPDTYCELVKRTAK
ncbi:MAG: phosphate propanoyltransferase [Roseibacillus sp.]|nr:phosphate propanoyltransferase [Roseibacillus sp.]